MNSFDLTPLFRTAIGFDHLASMLESANRRESGGYPPYNIELVDEDQYRITMAVAGFAEHELELEVEGNALKVSGKKGIDEGKEKRYLHHGIAFRNFERQFQLADHVEVVAASMEAGLLNIDLKRVVPEALKPRKIAIEASRSDDSRLIEGLKEAA
ncbi:hypothetical protein D5085_02910 [Ectothiorhodospiraceae bacterium BW-2]|nr:hypothetical protein D5085_02910 [Ectothiorhodospiraceae bacterium BW-2]